MDTGVAALEPPLVAYLRLEPMAPMLGLGTRGLIPCAPVVWVVAKGKVGKG